MLQISASVVEVVLFLGLFLVCIFLVVINFVVVCECVE